MGSKFLKIYIAFLFLGIYAFQSSYQPEDVDIFKKKFSHLNSNFSISQNVLSTAESFIETPYKGGTLEHSGEEELVVNLRNLDCWTLVENCIAIAHSYEPKPENPFHFFCQNIQNLRYRNGHVKGFGSRIHYFSEWIMQAEQNSFLKNISADLGGISYKNPVGFMTNNPKYYPKMKDKAIQNEIKSAEANIKAHKHFYIPKTNVRSVEKSIQDGDIIAITSSKSDLDVSHEGFACWHEGRVYLVHASSDKKKVVMSEEPLHEYLAKHKGQSGIMIGRLLETQ